MKLCRFIAQTIFITVSSILVSETSLAQVVVFAPSAPPPVRVEAAPLPRAGYIWDGGHWRWEHGRYIWRPGHWEVIHVGHHWVPGHWVASRGAWRWMVGHWA